MTDQFPTIETERLTLTELQARDISLIVKYANNEKISKYTQNLPLPYYEKDAIYWINLAHQGFKSGTRFIFAMRRRPANEFIGGISLTLATRFNRAEVGYWIAEPYWNQGYTTEATRAMVEFAFKKLGLNKVTSSHLEENVASGKVMLKSGMRKEGELQEHVRTHGVYHTLVLYGLTKKEYEHQRSA